MKMKLVQRLACQYALLFATPKMANFHYALFRLAIRGLGIMNYYDHTVSGEKYLIHTLLPKLIRNNNPVFFDVGANRGEYSLLLSNQFPNAQIFAFEPHPKNYEVLSKANLRNFFSYPIALSNLSGQYYLYDYAEDDETNQEASLHQSVITDIRGRESISYKIHAETLDSFVKSSNINRIDFLKIDTEGSEFAVLAGGENLVKQKRIDVIQFEFNDMNVVSHTFLYDFRKLLQEYMLFRLMPNGLLAIPDSLLTSELFGFQNIIAVSMEKTAFLKK